MIRKKDISTIDEMNQWYSKQKIKFSNEIKIKKREHIILNLFQNNLETYKVRNGYHCGKNRLRSFDDYLKLCSYYFPKFKAIDNLKYLFNNFNVKRKKQNKKIVPINYCPHIRKHNCHYLTNAYSYYNLEPTHFLILGPDLKIRWKTKTIE